MILVYVIGLGLWLGFMILVFKGVARLFEAGMDKTFEKTNRVYHCNECGKDFKPSQLRTSILGAKCAYCNSSRIEIKRDN